MAARLVDEPPKRFLGMADLIDETLVGFRLLDCVEVLALNFFDDRDFQRFDMVEIADKGGITVKRRFFRRRPAPPETGGAPCRDECVSTCKTRWLPVDSKKQ